MSARSSRGRRWRRLRLRAFEAHDWRCVKCGGIRKLEAHHVIPIEQGGAPMRLSNIVPLCRACHIAHHRPQAPRRSHPTPPGAARWLELAKEPI